MTRAVLLCTLLGCGATAPPPPPPLAHAQVVTRTSREAFAREIVALVAAGDAASLIALGDQEEALNRGASCTGLDREELATAVRSHRERLASAAALGKTRALQFLDAAVIGEPVAMKAGDRDGGCTYKLPVVRENVDIKLRIDGKHHTMGLTLVSVGGRYYIYDFPRWHGWADDDPRTLFLEHVSRVCMCADASCASAAVEAYAKAHTGQPVARPTAEDTRIVQEETTRMRECLSRLGPPTP
jgi:hypothetical protein